MISVYVISLGLLGLSGWLLDSHRRSWRAARDSTLGEREMRFARAQYRRRMQASSVIGVMGVTIGVGPLVLGWRQPGPLALYVAFLLATCSWIMLLAFLDIWATRAYYRRLRSDQLMSQLRLVTEFKSDHTSSDAES